MNVIHCPQCFSKRTTTLNITHEEETIIEDGQRIIYLYTEYEMVCTDCRHKWQDHDQERIITHE